MIDSHVHLWRLGQNDCVWPTADQPAIHRDVELAELVATLDTAGVGKAVLVQSQESARDTDWLLEIGRSSERIAGVVGWADLCDGASIGVRAADPMLVGLRSMVQDREPDWFDQPDLNVGFSAMMASRLVFDALIRPRHLPSLGRLAARVPELSIVIDHAAKPEGSSGLAAWRRAIEPIAGHANVHVKLSGLLTEVPEDSVSDVVATLLAAFGPERLLWGSDWPVLTMAGSYTGWLDGTRNLVPAKDRDAVFGGNAARLYRLEQSAHG